MNQCHNCGISVPDTSATVCKSCGTVLRADKSQGSPKTDDDQDLDFVVTEAAASEPEFVGGTKSFDSDASDRPVVKPAHETPKAIHSRPLETEASLIDDSDDEVDGTIGQSAPILPEPQEIDLSVAKTATEGKGTGEDSQFQGDSTDPVRKLSEDDVKEIEQDLYNTDKYISDREKSSLLNKINHLPVQSTKEINKPSTESTEHIRSTDQGNKHLLAPKMAGMGRGVAFFYKNYLHIPAVQEFYDGEELTVGERDYLIRPKKLNTRLFVGVSSLLFAALLFFVGSMFIENVGAGVGHVVGVVYNSDGSTNINGAKVRFPDLNLTVESDAEGFFKSGALPSGPHQVEYLMGGKVVMTEYVTVFDERVSTINLFPRQPVPEQIAVTKPSKPQELPNKTSPAAFARKETTPSVKQSPKSKPKKKNKSTRPARIKLNADVEGARFSLDGKVLGAGNLTFTRITPGKHSYTVSMDGFYDQTGTVKLASGETLTLEVALTPVEVAEKEVTFDYEDYYYSGVTALNEGDLDRAISDLDEAIDREPSYADAYLARGKTYMKLKSKQDAHDNFLRAAEIFVFKKDYNRAITAYSNSLDAKPKSVPAFIGRGQTYLAQGQDIAAVADFETAKRYDKRNFAAYFGMGEARFKQRYYKKAINAFKKARSLNSNHPLVHQYLMLSYLARDDFKNVKKSFARFKSSATEEEYASFVANKKSAAIMQVVNNR